MEMMQWNDGLLTGIEAVDKQHRGLVNLVNEVAPDLAFLGNKAVKDIGYLVDRLIAYTDEHFKTEEDLMARYQVDARVLDRHRKAHRELARIVTEMRDRSAAGEVIAGDEILSFLAGWLLNHLLGEDQSMARQIHAIEKGLTPDRAYREAGGYRTSPSEEVLTQVLIDLYKQLIHAVAR